VRYVRNAPTIRAATLRTGVVMFCASALFALLPSIAHRVSPNPIGYGVLLGCFGGGAVGGAVLMQWARARWSTEAVVSVAVAIVGATIIPLGRIHSLIGLMPLMVIGGAAWLTFISLANALVQRLAPDWVRARVLAIFMLVSQGGLAGGSVVWGALASRVSLEAALLLAGVATIATTALGLVARLPDRVADVTPWAHWRMPVAPDGAAPDLDRGPVLVTVEYRVAPERAELFLRAIQTYGVIRRRDGASEWEIFRDIERPDVYVETFVVSSWAEHLRQHDRLTRGDAEVERELKRYAPGDWPVRHLINAERGG
jgi:MFS family permease